VLTGEEIQSNLARLAARWDGYDRSEREGAQSFWGELLASYGVDWKEDEARFEYYRPGHGFIDVFKQGEYLVEMKEPYQADRLDKHRPQARSYWEHSADDEKGIPAPRYMVLCAFHRFEVWEPGRYPSKPRATFTLPELPDRYEALLFVRGSDPRFGADRSDLTIEATEKVAEIGRALSQRREGGPDERRDFILQSVWCMFAEDLGLIPEHAFGRIIDSLLENPARSSADDLGRLFVFLATDEMAMPRPTGGFYAGTPYANGGLFAEPAHLHLERPELELMKQAASFNWKLVEPAIFGNLLERTLGHEQQWHLGAHYTHEVEIQMIVEPTVVRPWQERLDNIESLEDAKQAQQELLQYKVLDPACGAGNFLYVAYRELRRIERDIASRATELAKQSGAAEQAALSAFFPIQNMLGLEINPSAVALARLTLWMGHKQAVNELQISERTMPLTDLSGIRVADALAAEWPRANAIIGNPPYHGSQNLRKEFGDERVKWLDKQFGCGVKDYCVYWFRRAADAMRPGDRAGLVGTNSISQNKARSASLNYVVEKGGVITDAISRRKWPGEAVVNVSIVNWIEEPSSPPAEFRLDGEPLAGINTRLRESLLPIEEYEPLSANKGRSFQGSIPGANFYLEDPKEIERLLALSDADYADVVRPYLIGDDITEEPLQRPRRHVIDFGSMTLQEAMEYAAALDLVRERVKPEFEAKSGAEAHENWWQFRRPRGKMRDALDPMSRFIAVNRIGKRFLFTWHDRAVCPSDLVVVFAFEDDYAMGVLTSSVHMTWADAEMSTLRVDRRYTPTSCFETFPWPDSDEETRAEIGRLAARLIEQRQEICVDRNIGLTELYNAVGEGAYNELAERHRALDLAVGKAYGWSEQTASDSLEVRRLLAERHAAIMAGADYEPFAYLGATV
jgi:hypothetical protein